MARETILSELTLECDYISEYGMYGCSVPHTALNLTLGEKYYVIWDGEEYTCTVEDLGFVIEGTLGLGNLSVVGGNGNNEPFCIGSNETSNLFFSTIDTEASSHTVAIYKNATTKRVTLFEEQTVEGFSYVSTFGCYDKDLTPSPVILAEEQEYVVLWDDEEYTRTAFQFIFVNGAECVGIGNPLAAGGEDNGDKFAIVHDQTNDYLHFFSLGAESSHTIGLFVIEEIIDGIILRDPFGRPVEYGYYKQIILNRVSGEKTIYSEGENIGSMEVDADFSNGNMILDGGSGKLIESVVVNKPETLLAENIKHNVEIAGVVGSLVCEGQEKSVVLDLSDGNQEVLPEDGYLMSKVTIQKPPFLVPEYIAEGVEIAGVVGEFKGGGGDSIFDSTDTNLRYFAYQLDVNNKLIILYGIRTNLLYAETESYDITIPDVLGGYNVVIATEGV